MTLQDVSTMVTDPDTQEGVVKFSATPIKSGRMQVGIVTNHANHILGSGYEFIVE